MGQSSYVRPTRRVAAQQIPAMPDIFDEEYDNIWPSSRMQSSVRRYRSDVQNVQTETRHPRADEQWSTAGFERTAEHPTARVTSKRAVPQRRTAAQSTSRRPVDRQIDTEDIIVPQRRPVSHVQVHASSHFHWTVFVGLGFICMLLGWGLLTVIAHWWQITQDDWHYGRPRTFQMDMVVGHADATRNPSHFIALNLNRHIQVIEFPGGDAANAKVYVGPVLVGPEQDLAPATLTFKDVNHDGKVDMIVDVQDSHFIFLNANGQFRPLRSDEHVQF